MHAVELANLTSTIVGCTPGLLSLEMPVRQKAAEQYWLACRFRHDSWSEKLAAHRHSIQSHGVSFRNRRWYEIVPVIQEVLLSEPLVRCMAYIAKVLNDQQIDHGFYALAQNALAIQIEARHRCLNLIVFGQGLSVELAVKLNRLRRILEAFTDELIAILPPIDEMDEFCFDTPAVIRNRALNSCHSAVHFHQLQLLLSLISEGLRRSLLMDVDHRIANSRLNAKISQAVLGLMPSEYFDQFGFPQSPRWRWYQKESAESTGRVNDVASPLAHPLNVLLAPPRQLSDTPKSNPRF